MGGARQKCPDCGSPLRPCKCGDEDGYVSPPGALANSTLGRRKRLRARGSGLRPGKPAPPDPEARERRRVAAYGPPARRRMVRDLKCGVPICDNPSENAHLPGAGGMGIKGPPETVVNLCAWHHTLHPESLHNLGSVEAFDERWGMDLRAGAAEVDRLWQERRASLEEVSMDG